MASSNRSFSAADRNVFLLGLAVGAAAATVTVAAAVKWRQHYRTIWKKEEEEKASVAPSRRRATTVADAVPAVPRRYGGAIQLKPEKFDLYTQLHDKPWPGVLQRMSQSNIRNFTIYYHQETNTLFSHFEWIGHWNRNPGPSCCSREEEQALFETDMKAIAADPVTRVWWKLCEPCQIPFSQWKSGSRLLSEGGTGDWWAPLLCVNHCGHWATSYTDELRDPDFVPQNPYGKTMEQPENIGP